MLRLKKILLELEKIDKLYSRYKSFLSSKNSIKYQNNFFSDKKINTEHLYLQKKIKFEEDIKRKKSELLSEYSNDPNLCKYLQQLLNANKIINNKCCVNDAINLVFNEHQADYSQYYDKTRYQELLLYSSLAVYLEKKGSPENYAFKLTVLFDNTADALKYIFRSIKNTKSFFQTCSFEIPKVNQCNFDLWRSLAKKYLHDDSFKKILPIASKIEDLVLNNNNTSLEKKLNYNKIRDLKNKIEKKNTEFKKINRHSINRDDETNNKKKSLIEEISTLRLALYHLTAGIRLEELDLPILLAYHEFHLKESNTEVYNYFLNHGLTKKDYLDKFLALKRVDDNKKIPQIYINGVDIGYPGLYLMKEPILNDMHAARASCLGKLTNCCQSLSGESGESCVIHGLTNPNGGFYVLCRGDINNPSVYDLIIAQSWAWRSQRGAIVFDSVESAYAANKVKLIKSFFNELAKRLVEDNHTTKVVCGSTAWEEALGIESLQNDMEYFIDYQGNYDSEIQSVVNDINNPYYWYDADEHYRTETEKIIFDSLSKKIPITSVKSLNLMLSWAISENVSSLLLKIKEVAKQYNRTDELNQIIENSKMYMESKSSVRTIFSKMINDERLLFYVRNKNGDIPLFYSIKNNFFENALKLIDLEAGIHLLNDDKTVLHLACMSKPFNKEIFLSLMNHRVNVCSDDYNEKTALHFLLENEGVNPTLVDMLITHGANVNATDCDGKTPLHIIANQKNISHNIINTLFKNGANPNIKDINDNTPLHLAIENGNHLLFKKLIEHKVDIEAQNLDGNTPLFLSVVNNSSFFLDHLINHGVNINEVNKLKKNVLHVIVERKQAETPLLEYFITKGVDVNATDICNRNPLHAACQQTEINTQKIKILIENGVNINAVDMLKQTPLHLYIYSRKNDLDIHFIKMLAEAGADMDIEDIYYKTVLDLINEKQPTLIRNNLHKSKPVDERSHSANQRKMLLFSRAKPRKDDVLTALGAVSENLNINTSKAKI